jgi:serine/threonine protein kinase
MSDAAGPPAPFRREWTPSIVGYRVLEEIGRGGFALVYRAEQIALRRTVAVKVVSGLDVDRTRLRRFERECAAIGSLSSHPHVVSVYDAGTTNEGLPFLSMEYLPEGSLADRLKAKGPLHVDDVIQIGIQLCGALEAAHQSDVLHRDIKPENILVGAQGQVKLADFGIAFVADTTSHTATGTMVGTVKHSAPEVLGGARATVSADVYSLGSTLFALLTGTAPFWRASDESAMPAMLRATRDPLPDLREHGVPDAVALLIEKACAKTTRDRFPSAAAFGEALQAIQPGLGDSVTPMQTNEVPVVPAPALPVVTPEAARPDLPAASPTATPDAPAVPDLPPVILDAPAAPDVPVTEDAPATADVPAASPAASAPDAPMTDAPVTDAPVTDAPVTEVLPADPSTADPSTADPSTADPSTADPSAAEAEQRDEPTADAPPSDSAELSITDAQPTDGPATEVQPTHTPATEVQQADTLAVDAPAADTLATEVQHADAPATEVQPTDAPPTEVQQADTLAVDAPAADTPHADGPGADQPRKAAPVSPRVVLPPLFAPEAEPPADPGGARPSAQDTRVQPTTSDDGPTQVPASDATARPTAATIGADGSGPSPPRDDEAVRADGVPDWKVLLGVGVLVVLLLATVFFVRRGDDKKVATGDKSKQSSTTTTAPTSETTAPSSTVPTSESTVPTTAPPETTATTGAPPPPTDAPPPDAAEVANAVAIAQAKYPGYTFTQTSTWRSTGVSPIVGTNSEGREKIAVFIDGSHVGFDYTDPSYNLTVDGADENGMTVTYDLFNAGETPACCAPIGKHTVRFNRTPNNRLDPDKEPSVPASINAQPHR